MARHRSHSIEFKRQVAQEFIAGETLHGLAARHGVSRVNRRRILTPPQLGHNQLKQHRNLQF